MTPKEFIENQASRGHQPAADLTFGNLTVRDEDSKTNWVDNDIIEFPAKFSVKAGETNVFNIPVGSQGKTTPAILVNIKTGDSINNAAYWYPNMAQKTVDAVINGKISGRMRTGGSVHDWWVKNAKVDKTKAILALQGKKIRVANSKLVEYYDRFDGMKLKTTTLYTYEWEGEAPADLK